MFDLSFLAQEPIVSIAGSSVTTAAINFLGYYYGERLQFNKMKQELITEKFSNPNSTISAVDIARCRNIKEIAQIADSLGGSSRISHVEFSPEWFTRFFDSASMVSDKDMQTIWAKILSEEADDKGKYSFRFIESMKLLSQSEAKTFAKLSKLVLTEPDGNLYVYAPSDSQLEIYESYGITDFDFLLMEECGLINMGVTQNHDIELDVDSCNGFYNGDLFVRFYSETLSDEMVFKFESYPLTRFGQQVYHLIENTSCKEFVLKLANNIRMSLEEDLIVAVHPILEFQGAEVTVDTDIDILEKNEP